MNAFLKITGKVGGFHQISSRFVLAYGKLYDEMRIQKSENFKLAGDFDCALEYNLVYKAKVALQVYFENLGLHSQKRAVQSVSVEVQKNIPKGAGLGGGSANAGVFLHQVNRLYDLGLNNQELCSVASNVGADVAFFASGEMSANVSGKGELISSFAQGDCGWEKQEVEIYTPRIFCDSKAVYGQFARHIKGGKAYSLPPQEWLGQSTRSLLYGFQEMAEGCEMLNDLYSPACDLYLELEGVRRELGNGWYLSGNGGGR